MSPTGKQACNKHTKQTPTFFTLGLLDPNGQMRQLHKTIWQFRLPDSCCVWRNLLFSISPMSILSADSYIKRAQQSVTRRLFHLPEVARRDEILGKQWLQGWARVNNDWLQGLGLVTRLGLSVWPHYHQISLHSCLPTARPVPLLKLMIMGVGRRGRWTGQHWYLLFWQWSL